MGNVTYYEDVFSVEEVANMLKISRRYILKLIREGKFGAMKIGKEYRIPKSVLDSFLIRPRQHFIPLRNTDLGFGQTELIFQKIAWSM